MENEKFSGLCCRTIADLREQVPLNQIVACFHSGSLEQWLKQHFYEREAKQVATLESHDDFDLHSQLCKILAIDPIASGLFTQEQIARVAQRRNQMSQYTQDPEILSHAPETAVDQHDLSDLLNSKTTKTIWLCGGPFSVPIFKGGIHYIGIGSPRIDGPFTSNQYRRAGITFQDVLLPDQPDPSMLTEADLAAQSWGYDSFAETHTPLTVIFNHALTCDRLRVFCWFDVSTFSQLGTRYKNKSQAERDALQIVNEAYDKANNFFCPDKDTNLAERIASEYAKHVRLHTDPILDRLQSLWPDGSGCDREVQQLNTLVKDCQSILKEEFKQELKDHQDDYQMYQRSYFQNRVYVETHNFDILYDGYPEEGLARLLQGRHRYTIEGYLDVEQELRKDLQDHAELFFAAAYNIYQAYCRRIEALTECLGRCPLQKNSRVWMPPEINRPGHRTSACLIKVPGNGCAEMVARELQPDLPGSIAT